MVKLGDSYSVRTYVKRELELGNKTNTMKQIRDEINQRIILLEQKLEGIKNNGE